MEKSFTILVAHPDDELLWCWPVLKNAKRIVCASSDLHNPERKRYAKRRYCLEEIGRRLGIEIICFDNNSGFYKLPTRDETLKRLAFDLMKHLISPVFTHNPWGEYGHLDHILCHQIARASGCELYCSNAAVEVNWLPIKGWWKVTGSKRLDQGWFDSLKSIYSKAGCWTWSSAFPTVADVVRVC